MSKSPLDMAALKLAMNVYVIERLATDPKYPGDRSIDAREARARAHTEYMDEFRKALAAEEIS